MRVLLRVYLFNLIITGSMCVEIAGHCGSQQIYLECLHDFERYAETNWHAAVYSNAPADAGYFGDGSGEGNSGIRASCGTALAYAVLANTFRTAASHAEQVARIRQTLNFAANTHLSGSNVCADGKRWGHSWQSSFLAGHMGLVGVVMQAQLPAATIQAVQRVVADEANYWVAIPPASGYVNDTKAEENAWDSHILALAAAWMTNDTNAGRWLTSAKRYLVNTHTVADKSGDPLESWITTVTHYPDFALENHGFYHPGYKAASGELVADSLLMARLANTNIAAQLQPFAEHNVLPAWTNLSHVLLDSGEMAFPAGEDWDLNDYEQNAYLAWLTVHFNDPLARWAEERVARLERYRQSVNGNGAFVGPSGFGFAREAIMAYRTALAWLQWSNADFATGPGVPPQWDLIHMPDVAVIAQRGSNGFFSICYGPQTNKARARINAIIEPPAKAFPEDVYTVTPRVPGVLGLGAMGPPTSARLVTLVTNANTFTAELQLTNGANGTTEVYVDCTGETIAVVEVPHPHFGFVNTAGASFTIGIENAPLNGGSRLLEWNNGSTLITNRSGALRNVTNDWLCIAGHYGIACGPAGHFKYQAATRYSHGTAEDTLQFIPTNSLAPRYAVWFPGKNAKQTLSNSTLVSWQVSTTNSLLSFPGPGGKLKQLVVTNSKPAR